MLNKYYMEVKVDEETGRLYTNFSETPVRLKKDGSIAFNSEREMLGLSNYPKPSPTGEIQLIWRSRLNLDNYPDFYRSILQKKLKDTEEAWKKLKRKVDDMYAKRILEIGRNDPMDMFKNYLYYINGC